MTVPKEACQGTFKIHKGPSNFALRRQKPNFVTVTTIIKVILARFKRVTGKFLRDVFALTIPLMTAVELITEILLFFSNVKHMSS